MHDGSEDDKNWLSSVLAANDESFVSGPLRKELRVSTEGQAGCSGPPNKELVEQKDGFLCPDWFWDAFGAILSLTFDRIYADNLGGEMEWWEGSESVARRLPEMAERVLRGFVEKPDQVREIDQREWPHAKKEDDTCTRTYYPPDTQYLYSHQLQRLGEASVEHGFAEAPTL